MTMRLRIPAILCSAALGGMLPAPGLAAEGFRLRYNVAGSLGPDLFAPPAPPGWIARVGYTYGSVGKVTGDDDAGPRITVPGGVVPLAPPAPAALAPSYPASPARINGTGSNRQWTVALGHVSEGWWGGRMAFGANLAYVEREQAYAVTAPTPALRWPAAAPPALRAATEARFGPQYQAALAAQAEGGSQSGPGDVELSANWFHTDGERRVAAGVSLALPTGRYDPGRGVDTGLGDFYTLRPSLQAAVPLGDDYVAGAGVVLGLNTRNRENDLRSGHWAGLEAALGRRIGPVAVGVQAIRLQQIQDDRNNPYGASRYRSTHAGVFLAGSVPALGASLSLQHTAAVSSRNALHGRFTQLRLTRAF